MALLLVASLFFLPSFTSAEELTQMSDEELLKELMSEIESLEKQNKELKEDLTKAENELQAASDALKKWKGLYAELKQSFKNYVDEAEARIARLNKRVENDTVWKWIIGIGSFSVGGGVGYAIGK